MTTVVVSGKDLAAATARVVKLIKVSDTGMQGSILVEYTGAKLRVTGANTHARLSVNMPVLEGDPQPESCVVPGKLIAGLSSKLKKTDVSFTFGNMLEMRAGTDIFDLGSKPGDLYPVPDTEITEDTYKITMDRRALAELFDRVGFAVAGKDTAQAISGAMIDVFEDQLVVAAPNRGILAVNRHPITGGHRTRAMVSEAFCEMLPPLVRGDGETDLWLTDRVVVIEDDTFKLIGRQLVRDALPYEDVLVTPKGFVRIEKKLFEEALSKVKLFSTKTTFASKFTFGSDQITIEGFSRDTDSQVKVTLPCMNDYKEVQVYLDANTLLGAVEEFRNNEIDLYLTDEYQPIRIDEEELTFVTAPIGLS